ncbi:hypothetical protein [Absidia glauca]|uniref:RNA polymerase II-associated protein 3 n=1 Tax=Absidia glauca TaxID=4829 RepID=A0A163IT09_ABSGL|nr:hypothetical protein [Absidia glauca]
MANSSNPLIWDNLRSWQADISEKDTLLNKRKPLRDPVLPAIRQPIDFDFDQKKPVGLNALKSNKTTSNTNTSGRPSKAQEKALSAKEKGNACFQQQQFQQAIRHYSEAIELDPTNAIYFVNRAMAHLKLKNYLQAEQDCTKCLELQPTHVKALWRRGIALRALGRSKEARKDFERALQIEPGNKLILEELDKLGPVDQIKQQHTAKKPSTLRTLPINVIDEAYIDDTTNEDGASYKKKIQSTTAATTSEKSTSSKITPSASTASKTPTSSTIVPTASATPVTPTSSTASSKIIPTTNTASVSSTPPPVAPTNTLSPLKLTCPRTNYEFERDWKACKRRGDDVIYQYLQCIPPTSYAALFKSSLEPDQFEKMIDIIHRYYIREKPDDEVLQILQGLGSIGRLDMLVMFLDKKSKQALESIFSKLSTQIPKPTLLPLASRFSVKLP